jgi:hypothetical protein
VVGPVEALTDIVVELEFFFGHRGGIRILSAASISATSKK